MILMGTKLAKFRLENKKSVGKVTANVKVQYHHGIIVLFHCKSKSK